MVTVLIKLHLCLSLNSGLRTMVGLYFRHVQGGQKIGTMFCTL